MDWQKEFNLILYLTYCRLSDLEGLLLDSKVKKTGMSIEEY